MKALHYGISIDSEIAITGVIHNDTPEWLIEEVYNGIDLVFEEHCNECPNEDHDLCWYADGSETILIGSWKLDEKTGRYSPDKASEYSGIMGEIYTQIVWSKYVCRSALCSPCYPGQGDLDTPGDYLAYDVPPDLY